MNKAEFAALSDDERIRVLSGTAYWSHLQRPDMNTARRFNSTPQYHLSLALDEEGVAKATSYGLKIHDANDSIPQPFVKLKRRVKDESNPDASRPQLVDSMQNSIPDSILIGNGSKVACKFGTYWYDAQGGGVGTTLFKVQVTDLVEYKGSGGGNSVDPDLSVDDSGWTVDSSAASTDEVSDSVFDVA